jgi:hypothetical protein
MKLTPWNRIVLEKLIFVQLVKKLLGFYGTQGFIYVYKSLPLVSVQSQLNPLLTFKNQMEGVEGYVRRCKLKLWIFFDAFAYFSLFSFFFHNFPSFTFSTILLTDKITGFIVNSNFFQPVVTQF